MGKTPAKKRLVMWVDAAYMGLAPFVKYAEQGHTIVCIDTICVAQPVPMPNVIFSKDAWRMTPEMVETKGMVELAIKAARLRKEGKDDEPSTDDE